MTDSQSGEAPRRWRIAVGGVQHETNTFAPTPTTLADFDTHGSSLPVLRGDQILTAFEPGAGGSIAGIVAALRAAPVDIAPLLWAEAQPGGRVTRAAFETLAGDLLARLEQAGPVDAVVLDLHGAMVVEGIEDAEGELFARIRRLIGPEPFLAAALDFHGNVSAAMVDRSDLLCAYRTYPHVDMRETGARVVQETLFWLDRGARPAKAFAQIPYLVPIHAQSTLIEPMADLFAAVDRAARLHGASTSLLPGFPPADIRDCGPSVLAYAADPDRAQAACDLLAGAMAQAEPAFARIGLREGPEAVDHALERAAAATAHPVVLVDTQDNPGAGATSDTMDLVRALLVRNAPDVVGDAVVAVIHDPAAAAAAHRAGQGAVLTLDLGGRGDTPGAGPLSALFRVEALGQGRFAGTGGYYNGATLNFGPMALLRVGDSGVRVIVGSQRAQAGTQAIFHHLGLDPNRVGIIGLKSSVHFLADFSALTPEIVYAAFPGLNLADPARFDYRNLRAGVRRRPLG